VRERLFVSHHRVWQIVIDAALVTLAFWLAFLLRFDFAIPTRYVDLLAAVVGYVVAVKVATFIFSGLYNKWWRYAGMRDLASLLQATVIASALAVVAAEIVARSSHLPSAIRGDVVYVSVPRGVIFLDWMLTFLLMGGARLASRAFWERPWRQELSRDRKKVLVVGAGDAGEVVVREMLKSREIRYRPVGFVDDDVRKKNLRIHGVRVVGTTRHLTQLVDEYAAEEVIIAIPSASGPAIEHIVLQCKKANVPVKTLPGVYELIKGSVTIEQLREVQVEDILGRGEVEVDLRSLAAYLDGKRVLVTGAGGSIGSELCRQIATMGPSLLLLVDHAEQNLFAIHHELVTERGFATCLPVIADVKNEAKMEEVFARHQPQVVFHAAAYKHVPMMEANPTEAFENNTFATHGGTGRGGARRAALRQHLDGQGRRARDRHGALKGARRAHHRERRQHQPPDEVHERALRQRPGIERQRRADLQAPDRGWRAGDGDRRADDALLHDHPGGRAACAPGRRPRPRR
jgi:FlaA1/EpsC-like NDP-sugar epimerase